MGTFLRHSVFCVDWNVKLHSKVVVGGTVVVVVLDGGGGHYWWLVVLVVVDGSTALLTISHLNISNTHMHCFLDAAMALSVLVPVCVYVCACLQCFCTDTLVLCDGISEWR